MRSRALCRLTGASLLLGLTLFIAGCPDQELVRSNSPTSPGGAVVMLTPGGVTTLRADGLDTLSIRADVGRKLVKVGREIEFKTTGGTLDGDTDADGDVAIPLDEQGLASVILRSSKTPGTFTVTARLMEGTTALSGLSSLQVTFVEGDENELIEFIEAPASAPADGATTSTFSVRISGQFPVDQRTVTFTTSAGSFSRGAVSQSMPVAAGTDLVARVLLYSPAETGPAFVSATVNGFRAEANIRFETARAEEILVSLDKFTLPQNRELVVTATLLRRVGIPTPGTIVRFSALDSMGVPFGTFRNVQRSQQSGAATATFLPDGGGSLGTALIEVTADGTAAKGAASFNLVAPAD